MSDLASDDDEKATGRKDPNVLEGTTRVDDRSKAMLNVVGQGGLKKMIFPCPQKIAEGTAFLLPESIKLAKSCPDSWRGDVETILKYPLDADESAYVLEARIDSDIANEQQYRLNLSSSGARLSAGGDAGLEYGFQTFLQWVLLGMKSGALTEAHIEDWPEYKNRSFMVDMGRSIFSITYLKRIVRVLARLKMNQLHLHLYDNELCGLKFDGLPFGHENPYALSISELKELVDYAADYHIEIVPELEAWGHVESIVYHREDLRGGKGMYGGAAFLVGEESFALMEELIRQVVQVMPKKATIHLGLDEAEWHRSPSMPDSFTPVDMVRRYYDLLQEVGADLGRQLTLRIWADHAGRPVPEDLKPHIIIEPWNYWNKNAEAADRSIDTYSKSNAPWMMGAGQSGTQPGGACMATRHWCRSAMGARGVNGVNICLWMWNDLDSKFITLFGGSYFAWNPLGTAAFSDQEDDEVFRQKMFPLMKWWQEHFSDASVSELRKDRGPTVWNGRYWWPDEEEHDAVVAPTAACSRTFQLHDFANEGVLKNEI